MKYPAYVVENDSTKEGCPFPGCIKVVCPDLLGYAKNPGSSALNGKDLLSLMKISKWVRPHYTHPMDTYIPALGEGIYVEPIRDNVSDLIWTGFFPGNEFFNLVVEEAKWTGVNSNRSEDTDRIIGTRNGSYIKIEDKIDGKIIIEVIGQTQRGEGDTDGDGRVGCKLILDSNTDAENIEILGLKKDGSTKNYIKLDITKDAEKILISSLGKSDQGLKEILLDQENDLVSIIAKSLDDSITQTFLMDMANKLFKLVGSAGMEILLDSTDGSELVNIKAGTNTNISMKKDGSETIIKNDATHKVTLTDSSVKIENGATQKIDMTATSIKLQGILGSVEVL